MIKNYLFQMENGSNLPKGNQQDDFPWPEASLVATPPATLGYQSHNPSRQRYPRLVQPQEMAKLDAFWKEPPSLAPPLQWNCQKGQNH